VGLSNKPNGYGKMVVPMRTTNTNTDSNHGSGRSEEADQVEHEGYFADGVLVPLRETPTGVLYENSRGMFLCSSSERALAF
jgi:hypothetical protein